ncbi:uncharacterized protein G2W53_036754 [Senna tora]|uniref:Uncharacterized protein n=1 Tax=Senna tora TaxID=362788 RepID=A0A834SUH9_9FABA|nr:uncharacterized protein G2W53_036754 [Senna tora]
MSDAVITLRIDIIDAGIIDISKLASTTMVFDPGGSFWVLLFFTKGKNMIIAYLAMFSISSHIFGHGFLAVGFKVRLNGTVVLGGMAQDFRVRIAKELTKESTNKLLSWIAKVTDGFSLDSRF